MARITSPSRTILARTEPCATSFPGLDAVADRGCHALRDMLERFGARGTAVERDEAELVTASSMQARRQTAAHCHFDARPLKGGFSFLCDADVIMRLVDLFYGGQGHAEPFAGTFCAADHRMIARIAAYWADVLPSVWREVTSITPEILAPAAPSLTKVYGRSAKLIIQPLHIDGLGPSPFTVSWVYPLDFLRQIPALLHDEQAEIAQSPDPQWHRQMRLAVNEISLPVRTIFARPEVPLSRLLTLKPGDVIPVCLPATVPVTVAGRVFAEATVGEASGRTAIKIARIAEGSLFHD